MSDLVDVDDLTREQVLERENAALRAELAAARALNDAGTDIFDLDAEVTSLRLELASSQELHAALQDRHDALLAGRPDPDEQLADRDRQIAEFRDALLEQARENDMIPSLRTQIAELTDRVVELTEAAEERERAHREETRLLVTRERTGAMTDEYLDAGEPT